MLGLLKRPSAQGGSSFKAGQSTETSSHVVYSNGQSLGASSTTQTGRRVTNGSRVFSPPGSVANQITVSKRGTNAGQQSTIIGTSYDRGSYDIVREQYTSSRAQVHRALGSDASSHVFDTSYAGLLGWIRNERLTKLPHKGGSWDRVLISAQYFAEQVKDFSLGVQDLTAESTAASHLVFGQCLLMLELGSENAQALETVFTLFYQFGVALYPLLRRADIFASSPSISENVGRAFCELVGIVSSVAITFYGIVHGQRDSTSIDIFSMFNMSIENFRYRIALCSQEIWNFALTKHDISDLHSLETLQAWLAPSDTVLGLLASNSISLASSPEQFTCTWLQSRLNSFLQSTNKTLVVEGKPGIGKTVLANWTVDRLQRPIGRKLVSTLNFSFNSSVPLQNTAHAMLKTLLWQMLSQRLGDIVLYKTLSAAYQELKHISDPVKQEEKLWAVFEKVVSNNGEDESQVTVIIIDGLDEIAGQKPKAQAVAKELHKIAQKNIRVIQFSQPLDNTTPDCVRINLSIDNMFDDLRTVVQRGLLGHIHFTDRHESEQEDMIERLALAADTSMLWASLATHILRLQSSHSGFEQTFNSLLSSPKTIPDIVEKLLSASPLTPDSKIVLSMLVAAQRPLLHTEIQPLLQVNPDRYAIDNNKPTTLTAIMKSLAPLTINKEGLLTLRHTAIRDAILSLSNTSKAPLPSKDPHKDLLIRILTNVHSTFRNDQEPTFNFLDITEVLRPLHSHKLLEYTVRYWTTHLKSSSLFKNTDPLDLPKEFGAIFPGTVTLPLLEETCWRSQVSPIEAVELSTTAYRVRKSIFGSDHRSVLQNAITLAYFYEVILNRPQDAIKWHTTVYRTGSKILDTHNDVVVHSCTIILKLTETSVTTSRTEIMTFREEVLKTLHEAYTYTYGSTSREVLEINKKITDLYVAIGDTKKLEEWEKTVKGDTHHHHHHHHDTTDKGAATRSIDVTLTKHKQKESIITLDSLFHGYHEETKENFDLKRVLAMIERAAAYVRHEEFEKAEDAYIELWWKLTEHCHTVRSLEWHEKKLEVMITYARFLLSRKRTNEASSVLLTAWREYEHNEFSMYESIIMKLKEVATIMKSVGMYSVALTVYQRCWSWFRNTHKDTTSVYKSVEEDITICSRELVKTSTSTKVTASSETIMREVFEHSIVSTTEVSSSTMELARSLTSVYMEESRYTQATTILETTLKKTWTSFFSESIDNVSLESKHSTESVVLVLKLAQCYISQKRFEKAEEIYLRLYRVYRKTHGVDHVTVIEYRDKYINFVREYKMHNQLISFYQELLVDYRAFYGASHKQTITILYHLADTCHRYHLTHGYWVEYYLEIVSVLNKGESISHEAAFRAVVIIAEHYYETERYTDSLIYFKCLVATFIKHSTQHKYSGTITDSSTEIHKLFQNTTRTQELFEKYYRAIVITKLDIHEHVKILKELRESCIRYYGESSTITLHATVTLAETCEKSEMYQHEAISYYEHVSKHEKFVSSETIKRTQTILKSLYVKQITSSSTSTSMSKEMSEKASKMLYEQYSESRRIHSCTHETTLTQLRELISLYHKQSRTDLITKELQSVIVEAVTKVHSTKELIYTAEWLASTYTTYEYRQQALEIVRDLKLQVIYKTTSKSSTFNVTTATRSCFPFIAAFEYHIRGDYTLSIAHYMSELVAEYLFYERFVQSIKARAKLDKVFIYGARLRHILYHSRRVEDFSIVESQLVNYFSSTETAVSKATSPAGMRLFVSVVLQYISERPNVQFKDFVIAASYASVGRLRVLIKENREQEALDLATCTFHYLMAHEGLDDPTEITIGFQLSLMTAGRGEFKYKSDHPALKKAMMALSKQILQEVFDICKANKIDIARAKLVELNELISLVGDHNDYTRLRWLLHTLWTSREGQATWQQDTILDIGRRLVQAEFSAGKHTSAIHLCEDIVYNIRRVHGARHPRTLEFYSLLAELYTSTGQHIQTESGKQDGAGKKRSEQLANMYFKKAVGVHEEVLKLLVDDGLDNSGDEDDLESEIGAADSASANGFSPRRVTNGHTHASNGFASSFSNREEELEVVQKHLKLLRLAIQRCGNFPRSKSEFERLTNNINQSYGSELKMKDTDIGAGKWKIEGYGLGASESQTNEGAFTVPKQWSVVVT